jgi:hypothetical protein
MAQAARRSACDMGIAGPDKAQGGSLQPWFDRPGSSTSANPSTPKANSTSVESSCGRPGLVAALVELQASGLADRLGPTQPHTIRALQLSPGPATERRSSRLAIWFSSHGPPWARAVTS